MHGALVGVAWERCVGASLPLVCRVMRGSFGMLLRVTCSWLVRNLSGSISALIQGRGGGVKVEKKPLFFAVQQKKKV
jgi:hypothetical protein